MCSEKHKEAGERFQGGPEPTQGEWCSGPGSPSIWKLEVTTESEADDWAVSCWTRGSGLGREQPQAWPGAEVLSVEPFTSVAQIQVEAAPRRVSVITGPLVEKPAAVEMWRSVILWRPGAKPEPYPILQKPTGLLVLSTFGGSAHHSLSHQVLFWVLRILSCHCIAVFCSRYKKTKTSFYVECHGK